MSVEWHERVVESDTVTVLCAAANESASCAVTSISTSIEPSPDSPEPSEATDSPLCMRDATDNDDGESEAIEALDEGANGRDFGGSGQNENGATPARALKERENPEIVASMAIYDAVTTLGLSNGR